MGVESNSNEFSVPSYSSAEFINTARLDYHQGVNFLGTLRNPQDTLEMN